MTCTKQLDPNRKHAHTDNLDIGMYAGVILATLFAQHLSLHH
jgi:hypothetical protein